MSEESQECVSSRFTSIAEAATPDVHLLHNGQPLFDRKINLEGQGPEATFEVDLAIHAGDTIDAICGWGNQDYGADTTALDVTVRSATGTAWDAPGVFHSRENPHGAWSYGTVKPGKSPDSTSFTRFATGSRESSIGSLSNPGSRVWEDVLSDLHPYQRVPHTADVIHTLRTIEGGGKPVWLSEYGIGSAIDLIRVVRWYEQIGKTDVEDALLYRNWRDQYLADWQRYHLDQVFARPEDFFSQSLARMAGQRLLGINAIRSNPNVVGHSLTGTLDQGMTAEGVWTTFRELKPGATDALCDAWAPLRWCLFAEPANVYRHAPVRLEAVLANEDVLPPGRYPVRFQMVGPDLARLLGQDEPLRAWIERQGIKVTRSLPEPQTRREVILLSGKPPAEPSVFFPALARLIARGSSVVFLTPEICARGSDATGWLPLRAKGRRALIARWLYHADEWARRPAVFDGLPSGGLMDDIVYRELIPDTVFIDIEPAADPLAGSIHASQGYQSGLLLGVYPLAAGEFALNALRIRENLGKQPVADRLLLNLLRFAGRDVEKPLAALPDDLVARFQAMGY